METPARALPVAPAPDHDWRRGRPLRGRADAVSEAREFPAASGGGPGAAGGAPVRLGGAAGGTAERDRAEPGGGQKGGDQRQGPAAFLADLSVAEVERLLVVADPLPQRSLEVQLAWSDWRLAKRQQARRSHYRRRSPLGTSLHQPRPSAHVQGQLWHWVENQLNLLLMDDATLVYGWRASPQDGWAHAIGRAMRLSAGGRVLVTFGVRSVEQTVTFIDAVGKLGEAGVVDVADDRPRESAQEECARGGQNDDGDAIDRAGHHPSKWIAVSGIP